MKKARINYLVDAFLALMGVASGITGIILLLMGHGGGYRGGRNPGFVRTFLGMERGLWSDLHTWVSIALMVGVVIHIALHWNWIVCTTRAMLRSLRRPSLEEACPAS